MHFLSRTRRPTNCVFGGFAGTGTIAIVGRTSGRDRERERERGREREGERERESETETEESDRDFVWKRRQQHGEEIEFRSVHGNGSRLPHAE